jgi:hypothetical protein
VLSRNLEDRTEYAEQDIYDSFGNPATNVEEGAALVVHTCNLGIFRGIETRSKEVEAADASVLFGIGQPRLELDIHKTSSASSPEANVDQLQ